VRVLAFHYYDGPNRHCLSPVAESDVDLLDLATVRSDRVTGLVDGLLRELPGLQEHHCSRGYAGGFVERLREGTYLGHVVEHVTLELLAASGERVFYGKTREIAGTRVRIVFEAETRQTAWRALQESMSGVEGLARGERWPIGERLKHLREEWAQYRWGPSTRAIVDAARRRGIPVARLDHDSLVRLGQGVHRVLIRATLTERTSAIAVDRAQDKEDTKRALRAAGLPVPEGWLVRTLDEALALLGGAERPLVVKPPNGRQGQGVSMDVSTPAEMTRAFQLAGGPEQPVLVETQVPGRCYRLMVVGGRMVAAAERMPPIVDGDGHHSVAALIDRLNQDPRRGPGHSFPMTKVTVDGPLLAHLARQGLTLESVPPAGMRVALRASANLSTGATARDATEEIGDGLAADAVRAAQAVGLDVAGVDVVTPDPSRALAESSGVVLEVNAAPGIRMHEAPAEGQPRAVGQAIVDYLFPDGATGRIPVAAVTGTNGKTTVTRMLAHIYREAGYRVGMTTTDGIWIGDRQVAQGDLTGPWSARLVLNDPQVEAAVLETARGGIARGGLGFDDCDLAVVTNIGEDHLGQDDVEDLDDLVHLKSLVVEVVRPDGAVVLNADDPRVLGMAERARAPVVLFAQGADNLAVRKCLMDGGRAVFVRRGHLVYAHGDQETRLGRVAAMPATMGGLAGFNVMNLAAAAAAALAAGIGPKVVARALETFPAGGQGVNRGRLEVREAPDLTVIVDYAHNAPAVGHLGAVCRKFRRHPVVTVLGLPGDRRNKDLEATARAVARFSDRIVVREDHDLRGRAPGEVAELLRGALLSEGLSDGCLRVIPDEAEAVEEAVRTAPPGGLVLVLYERYRSVVEAVDRGLKARELAASLTNSSTETGIG
jgi:cyanophycin synthetase